MKTRNLFLCVLLVCAGVVAVTSDAANRTDPGFVYQGLNGGNAPLGGGTCASPPVVNSVPFSDIGDTCDGTNTITTYGGACTLPFPYGGEDEVYQVNIGTGNNLTFTADLTGSAGDLVLFLIGTCGDGTSCEANSQDAIGPGVGPEVIDPASYTPGTYFLYVDSYYDAGTAGSCGAFNLSITGTLPVELIDFSID